MTRKSQAFFRSRSIFVTTTALVTTSLLSGCDFANTLPEAPVELGRSTFERPISTAQPLDGAIIVDAQSTDEPLANLQGNLDTALTNLENTAESINTLAAPVLPETTTDIAQTNSTDLLALPYPTLENLSNIATTAELTDELPKDPIRALEPNIATDQHTEIASDLSQHIAQNLEDLENLQPVSINAETVSRPFESLENPIAVPQPNNNLADILAVAPLVQQPVQESLAPITTDHSTLINPAPSAPLPVSPVGLSNELIYTDYQQPDLPEIYQQPELSAIYQQPELPTIQSSAIVPHQQTYTNEPYSHGIIPPKLRNEHNTHTHALQNMNIAVNGNSIAFTNIAAISAQTTARIQQAIQAQLGAGTSNTPQATLQGLGILSGQSASIYWSLMDQNRSETAQSVSVHLNQQAAWEQLSNAEINALAEQTVSWLRSIYNTQAPIITTPVATAPFNDNTTPVNSIAVANPESYIQPSLQPTPTNATKFFASHPPRLRPKRHMNTHQAQPRQPVSTPLNQAPSQRSNSVQQPVNLNTAHKVVFQGISGAPGDGNQTLHHEIKQLLENNNVQFIRRLEPGAHMLSADISVIPKGSTDYIKITWTMMDHLGEIIGQVSQENDVPSGSLNGAWGQDAFYAAMGARAGLLQLLETQ